MENDHPGLGLDVRHPSTTHPRLDSMEDFPDLHPSKLISQVRPTASRRQVKNPVRLTTETNPKLKNANKLPGTKSIEGENAESIKLKRIPDEKTEQSDKQDKRNFNYNLDGKNLKFEIISDKRVKCPECKKEFKNILCHLQKSTCRIPNLDDLSEKFQEFKRIHLGQEIKQRQNERKAKSVAKQKKENDQKFKNIQKQKQAKFIAKKREHDEQELNADQKNIQKQKQAKYIAKRRKDDAQKLKTDQNEWKAKYIAKQRKEDAQKLKTDQNEWKVTSIAKQRKEDEQKLKTDQNERKAKSIAKQSRDDVGKVREEQNRRSKLSRNKRKLEDPIELSKNKIQVQKKRRKIWKAADRLREFKESTKFNVHNPITMFLFRTVFKILAGFLILRRI